MFRPLYWPSSGLYSTLVKYLQCILGDEISFTIVRWYNLNFMAQDRISCYKVLNSDGCFAIKGRVKVC
jgi:hypothetical protein